MITQIQIAKVNLACGLISLIHNPERGTRIIEIVDPDNDYSRMVHFDELRTAIETLEHVVEQLTRDM